MRKYAIVKDQWVEEIIELETKEEVRERSMSCIIIDIEDQPDVTVGWFFTGNKLTSYDSNEAHLHIEYLIARNSISPAGEFGTELVKRVRDKIGARNIRLGVTESQITTLVSNLSTIKMLCEGSALRTARSLIIYIRPSYPQYDDILGYAVDEINANIT